MGEKIDNNYLNPMSVWRRKAIVCLPGIDVSQMSIYETFMEIRAATEEAHESGDTESLRKFYGFAEWCFNQRAKDLWNAAGVCFYEHLGDHPNTRDHLHLWVKRSIYFKIRGLLEERMSADDLRQVDLRYVTL